MANAREGKRVAQAKAKKGVVKAPTMKKAGVATKRKNPKRNRTPSDEAAYTETAAKIPELVTLAHKLAFLKSGRAVYCAVPEIKRLVALGNEMMDRGVMTAAQLYKTCVSSSYFSRYRKIDHFTYLRRLAKRKQLNSKFLDAWNSEQPLDEAGEDYAKKVGQELLEKEDEAEDDMFESLAETTARVTWGKGTSFKMPKGYSIYRTSDKGCPFTKGWIKTQASMVVTTVLKGEFSAADVKKWVAKANGKSSSFYFVSHNEEIVGFLYHEKADFEGKYDVDLIRAYGVVERLKNKGVGLALIYSCFHDLPKSPYICADIDSEHLESLACVRRAAPVFGRKLLALGRVVMRPSQECELEWNRHPRPGTLESKEWCCMLKGVPDFEERENEEHWPALEEEDVSATKGREDKQEEGKPKEKNMVMKQKRVSRNLRGRPHKSIQYVKKGTKKREEEKIEKEIMKKEKRRKSKRKKSEAEEKSKITDDKKIRGGR